MPLTNYSQYTWYDNADGGTPINATRLNAIEAQLEANDNALPFSLALLTATPSELNVLDGITASTAELNYTDGVTSNIQTQINTERSKALSRDLNILLNLSLNTTNIDAWGDLLGDTTRINTSSSSNYVLTGGTLIASIQQTTSTSNDTLGNTSTRTKEGQTFTVSNSGSVSSIAVLMSKSGSPTDNIVMKIYSVSSGLPNALLYTSSTTLAGSSVTTDMASYTFSFSGASLTAGTVYAFILERSGSVSSSDYYLISTTSSSVYSGGTRVIYNGSSWSTSTDDMYFVISGIPATIVWNAVTSTAILTYMAVSASSTGTITWYVSSNGSTWTQITSLNAAQAVSFSSTSVYLKCVINSSAVLYGVAWGGY